MRMSHFVPQKADLITVLKSNHATLFGELHCYGAKESRPETAEQDEKEKQDLTRYYQHIFETAAAAGIKDVMLEMSPRRQADLDETYAVYQGMLQKYSREQVLEYVMEPSVSVSVVLVTLASIYGLKPHAVDVGDRQEIDIYTHTFARHDQFMREHPDASFEDFKSWFGAHHLDTCTQIMQRSVTVDEIIDIVILAGKNGIVNVAKDRVRNGDKKIAVLMEERSEGRPFISIFGLEHGAMIDEHKHGFEEVDLDGALRLIYGAHNVAQVTLNQGKAPSGVTNYVLHRDLTLYAFSEPAVPPPADWMRLVDKHGLRAAHEGFARVVDVADRKAGGFTQDR